MVRLSQRSAASSLLWLLLLGGYEDSMNRITLLERKIKQLNRELDRSMNHGFNLWPRLTDKEKNTRIAEEYHLFWWIEQLEAERFDPLVW